jgi:hypothetical protein
MVNANIPIEGPSIGFDFSNYARNQFIGERMHGLPRGESLEPYHCKAAS